MAYCLDANILMEAHRRRFPPELFPVFWDRIHEQGVAGAWLSIQEIYLEIQKGNDALAAWAEARKAFFVDNNDKKTTAALEVVRQHVDKRLPAYKPQAKTKFFACADSWVIGFCMAHGHVLVTEEAPAPGSLKDVKIPDVAIPLGVRVIKLNDMLSELKVKFS